MQVMFNAPIIQQQITKRSSVFNKVITTMNYSAMVTLSYNTYFIMQA